MEQDPKKLTRAHKIALGVISLACCCIIGISAFALAAPGAVSELAGQQEEQAAEQEQQQNAASSEESTSADGSEAGSSNESGSSSQDNASAGNGDSPSSGSSNGGGSNDNNSSSPQNGTDSSGSGQSGSGSSGSQGGTETDTVTVSVSVSSNAADGRVSGSAAPTFEKGATAYDALCATGLSVTAKSSQYGIYVSAIGGLAEFEYGGSSGWMYSVNGTAPNVSCGKYVLKDGDRVSWYYVV